MTSTAQRPHVAERLPDRPPVLATGLAAGVWAAGAGLVAVAIPVLLGWAGDARSGAGPAAALRAAGLVWVLAHGTPLHLSAGELGLTPLGLLLVPLPVLWRAGRHAARRLAVTAPAPAARAVAATAVPYAVLVAGVAGVTATPGLHALPMQAACWGLLVGVAGAGGGVLRESGLGAALLRRTPRRPAALARCAAAALAVLLGAGAALVATSLVVHVERATALARTGSPGLLGGLLLLLLGAALVPNAAVWGASWVAGPGFAVGAGTAVGPLGTNIGAVPALPLLAAVPTGAPPGWAAGVLALPVLAGALAGWLSAAQTASWRRAAGEAAAVGLAVGAVLAVLGELAGGPVGVSRLTRVGPSAWRLGLAVALEVAVPAVAAALLRQRSRRTREVSRG